MGIKSNNKIIISAFIVLIMGVSLLISCPRNLEDVYFANYFVDSVCLLISIILLLGLYINDQLDMFEPLTIVSLVYIMMYFFTPIYDICVGEYTWYGYDLFQYGVKSTIIAFIGFLSFYIFYTHYFVLGEKKLFFDSCYTEEMEIENVSIPLILTMYVFCFGANVYYLTKSGGMNLLYLLTLGTIGSGNAVTTTEASIGFISMFSYSLPAVTLLYWEFGNSKMLKIVLFVPMLMLQVARGFRFFVIQIAITFFAYHYMKKGIRPKITSILLAGLVVMIPILLMTMFRTSIRAGSGIDIGLINSEGLQDAVEAAIWDNFRIYQNFYGMVPKIPIEYPYVYGRQIILGTIFMVIPRIIWPGKLSSYGGEGLATIIGGRIASGQAYPNIGEYYYAGGILGVIVCMGIYGLWMKYVRDRFMQSRSGLDGITFSVLLGANLQLVIRGYTPSNFWYVVFAILPIWIIRKTGIRRG